MDIEQEQFRNNLSNSESLCRSDTSHKVSAQSDMVLKEISFEEYQDGGHLGYMNGTILAILNDNHHCDVSHQVLTQPDLRFGRRCRLKNFKMAAVTVILDIGMERF